MTTINIAEIVGRGYAKFWNFKGRYRCLKGGRGSKKILYYCFMVYL